MKDQLQQIKASVEAALNDAATLDALEEIRIKYMGKKGELTAVLNQTKS